MEPFTHDYFMRKALLEAQNAFDLGEVPVGTVIVHGNHIIAKGHNLTEQLTDVTAHAEMIAITSAANYIGGKYLQQCRMYVTLEPCTMCAGALYWSQIGALIFAAPDEKRGFLSKNIGLHPKTKILSGVLEKESQALLNLFFSRLRK